MRDVSRTRRRPPHRRTNWRLRFASAGLLCGVTATSAGAALGAGALSLGGVTLAFTSSLVAMLLIVGQLDPAAL